MTHPHDQSKQLDRNQNHHHWLFSRASIAIGFALAVIGFLIYKGHGAHLLGATPYLLLLACPLMHLFMHGGHGNHSAHGSDNSDSSDSGKM